MMGAMAAQTLVAERFEVVRETGSGGMGTVYYAHDRQAAGELYLAMEWLEGRDLVWMPPDIRAPLPHLG